MNAEYNTLIEEGIRKREKGTRKDLQASVRIFIEAEVVGIFEFDEQKRLNAKNERGLSLCHLGQFEEARELFLLVVEGAAGENSLRGEQAVAFRNLSRKELLISGRDRLSAYDYALIAYSNAKILERTDLVWFTHGVINAVYTTFSESHQIRKMIKKLILREAHELLFIARTAKDYERQVWSLGLLMDVSRYYKVISKPVLKIALSFAKRKKLTRRIEQIEKLLKEL